MRITEPQLPVVNVGSSNNPSYLPMQVCQVVLGQPAGTLLSPTQTQQMIRFAVRKPHENARHITNTGVQQIGLSPSSIYMVSWKP